MAKSGINIGFAKCFIVFMAITILVQGCVYLGLASWGIKMRECSDQQTNIKNDTIKFVMNLIYLSDEECGNPTVKISDIIAEIGYTGKIGNNGNFDTKDDKNSMSNTGEANDIANIKNMGIINDIPIDDTQEIEIDWEIASIIKNRMHIFLIIYAVISISWIITSLIVLASICCTLTKCISAFCYWPWFLVVVAGSILDAVATAFFINDIYNTTSAETAMDYIGVVRSASNAIIIDYLKTYDPYFITPAVAMTCISSRVVLIWLLNVFGIIFCLSLSSVISSKQNKDAMDAHQKLRSPINDVIVRPRLLLPNEQENPVQSPWKKAQTNSTEIPPKPLPIPRPVLNRDNSVESNVVLRRSVGTPSIENLIPNKNNNNNLKPTLNKVGFDSPTYRVSELHPENLDYPTPKRSFNVAVSPANRSTSPQQQSVSPTGNRSPLIETPSPQNQHHISEELRSQLPWSYTNLFMDPQVQRKIHSHLQVDDEPLPPIPVPDYTLHHPKRERPQVDTMVVQQPKPHSRW